MQKAHKIKHFSRTHKDFTHIVDSLKFVAILCSFTTADDLLLL
jgi:hypothetical protein